MNPKRHLLVIDPTAFPGGSKVATENILRLVDRSRNRITILTADRASWSWPQLKRVYLYQPQWLADQQQGILYFLRHIIIAINLLVTRLRSGQFDIAVGASGPGVDLSLYIVKPILRFRLVQLIHGPVANSRTIGRCLRAADEVHYLESTRGSLLCALSKVSTAPQNLTGSCFQILQNGLSSHSWPSRCQTKDPVIFWAASLLKWKGLEILLDALRRVETENRPETHICYIKPKQTLLPISHAPVAIDAVHWHENPEHLNKLRATGNIFVSTSRNEPFGLSILEAMAAGQCMLIPEDGAYWDGILIDGIDCIKYTPGDAADLANKIFALSRDMNRVRILGAAAAKVALGYRAEIQYTPIKNTLEGKSLVQNLNTTLHHMETEITP